jgi:hypothetical protein
VVGQFAPLCGSIGPVILQAPFHQENIKLKRMVFQRKQAALALTGGVLVGLCLAGCQTSPGDPTKNPYGAAPPGMGQTGPGGRPASADYTTKMKGMDGSGGQPAGNGPPGAGGPPGPGGGPPGTPYGGGGPGGGPPGTPYGTPPGAPK